MPIWAWLGFVVLILINSRLLWQAWRQRQLRYGPITYAADESPGYFWFFVIVLTLTEALLLIFFGMIITQQI